MTADGPPSTPPPAGEGTRAPGETAPGQTAPGAPATSSAALGTAVALVTYVGLALFLYAHVAFSGGARYPDCACGDQTQETWFLRWPLVSLTHGLDPFFTKFMNSPHGVNLAVNTSSPLLGLLSIPFQLTVGAAVTYDLFLPLSMAASAASLFFVLRRWVPSPWIRLAGGLLYGFSPYMIGQGHGHLFLTAAFVPPIVLLVLDNLLSGRRSSRWSGVALGALAVAQYLISPEVLAMTAVLGAVGLVVLAVANPRRVRAHLHRLAVGLAWAAVVAGALLAYPIWFALAGPQHISGPVHPIADLNRFSGDLLGAVVPTVSQHLAPAALKARGSALTAHSPVENGLYLGIPLIAVLIGLTVRFRRHRPLWFFGAMTVAAWLLALGARATVDRTRTSVPLPFAALLHVPLVNDIESARFSLFMALFAACWLSIGLARLAENRRARAPAHQRRSRRVEPATVVVGLVALVPLAPFGPFQGGPAPVPSFYTSAAAARIPWGSVALTYPYPTPATAQPLLDQAMAGLRYKVLGGYAFVPAVGGGSTLEPPLLPPPSVQGFLGDAYAPPPGVPPAPGAGPLPVDAGTVGDLRTYLTRYGVQTVLVDPVGYDPGAVVHLVTAAIGPGLRTGGTTVWYDVRARLALLRA